MIGSWIPRRNVSIVRNKYQKVINIVGYAPYSVAKEKLLGRNNLHINNNPTLVE